MARPRCRVRSPSRRLATVPQSFGDRRSPGRGRPRDRRGRRGILRAPRFPALPAWRTRHADADRNGSVPSWKVTKRWGLSRLKALGVLSRPDSGSIGARPNVTGIQPPTCYRTGPSMGCRSSASFAEILHSSSGQLGCRWRKRSRRTRILIWFGEFTHHPFFNRTPGPPPFSSMNSTPAASSARRIAKSLADVSEVSFSINSARRIVATLSLVSRARSSALHLIRERAALI